MPELKERPILFSAPMVRATLEGRKTVTRRAVKKQAALDCLAAGFEPAFLALPGNADLCPYGQTGDRLWVRETWGVISHDFDEHGNMIDWEPDRPASPIREMPFGHGYYSGHVIYRADGEAAWAGDDDGGGDDRSAWKPSIHMPRIASRILLEITAVRVERLQDITYEQARPREFTEVRYASGARATKVAPATSTRCPPSAISGNPSAATGTPTRGYGWSSSSG